MKRFLQLLFTVCAVLLFTVPALAQDSERLRMQWETAIFRTTSAASVALQPWYASRNTSGYLDSTVFREGAATATLVDTTMGYHISRWALPPTMRNRGTNYSRAQATRGNAGPSTQGVGLLDSVAVDTLDATPWLVLAIEQDTTSYSFSGSTSADSVFVAAQWSVDGVNWTNVQGTPTRGFLATTIVTAADGRQPPAITVTESHASADNFYIPIQCQPSIWVGSGTDFILNRTLCMLDGYVRFIVGKCDGTGQFRVRIGHW